MGYLYTLLAVSSNEVNGYCGKMSSNYTAGLRDAMLFNAIRMGIAVLMAMVISVISGGIQSLKIHSEDVISIVMSGIFNPIFLVTWLISIKTGAYLMVSVFLMLGVIVPSMGSQILYGEMVYPFQWLGFGILLLSAVVLCSYNNKIKTKIRFSDLLLLLACGLSCGLNDFSQKIFTKNASGTPVSTFNCYAFLVAAFVLLMCYFVLPKDKRSCFSKGFSKSIMLYIGVMAACLFLYAFFQTQATKFLSTAVTFPMTRGLSLVFSAAMAAICFKEKINLKCIIGIVLALTGILIINIPT